MTNIGIMRLKYCAQIEKAPSRFIEPIKYKEWAKRADLWYYKLKY